MNEWTIIKDQAAQTIFVSLCHLQDKVLSAVDSTSICQSSCVEQSRVRKSNDAYLDRKQPKMKQSEEILSICIHDCQSSALSLASLHIGLRVWACLQCIYKRDCSDGIRHELLWYHKKTRLFKYSFCFPSRKTPSCLCLHCHWTVSPLVSPPVLLWPLLPPHLVWCQL